MLRNLGSFLGNALLVTVLGASLVGFSIFFDALGILPLPEGLVDILRSGTPAGSRGVQPEVPTQAEAPAKTEVPAAPEVLVNPTAPAVVLPTPVPPLPAPQYRDVVMIRLKSFAQALQNWLDASGELSGDPSLAGDPVWQDKTRLLLGQVTAAAQDLDQAGPAPAEYAGVDAQLKRILPEAYALEQNFEAGLQTGDPGLFEAAGTNFAHIQDLLALAVGEMGAAGWPLEP